MMHAIKGSHIHISDAQALEAKDDLQGAASMYEALQRQSPKNLSILHRLLVLHRKLGNTKKEIQYIDAAIKVQQQKYKIQTSLNKKVTTLSNQLNKILGHTDKKGKPVLVAEEVVKLELRKARLLKKLAAPKKKK